MNKENPQLEQKTSGEIFEDVFNDNSLDNKNKLWISKDSLYPEINEVYNLLVKAIHEEEGILKVQNKLIFLLKELDKK
jgi:uncharacterized iron-regulated protein